MTDDDLLSHVARMRRQRSDDALVEARAAVRDLPKSIWDTISAFANTDGGTVILGLDEREDFQPAEGFTESVANRRINALITGLNTSPQGTAKVLPVPGCHPERATVDGRPVVVLDVPSLRERPDLDLPCHVVAKGIQNGSFKRVDDHDVRLSSYEVYVLASRRIEDRTDREPVTGTSLEDLDPRSVDRLLTELRSSSSHILDHIAEDDREAALRRLNVLTSDSVPTLSPPSPDTSRFPRTRSRSFHDWLWMSPFIPAPRRPRRATCASSIGRCATVLFRSWWRMPYPRWHEICAVAG